MDAIKLKGTIIVTAALLLTNASLLSNAEAATTPPTVTKKTPAPPANTKFNDSDIGNIVKKNINRSVKKELKGLRQGEATTRKAMEFPKRY